MTQLRSRCRGRRRHGVVIDEEDKPVSEAEIVYRIGDGIGFTATHSFRSKDGSGTVSSAQRGHEVSRQRRVSSGQPTGHPDHAQARKEIRMALPSRPKGGSVAGVVTDAEAKANRRRPRRQ